MICIMTLALAAIIPAPQRWHVEVRDVRGSRSLATTDPHAGRPVEAFDVDEGGAAFRSGPDVPYVDRASIPNAAATGTSPRTVFAPVGLTVSIGRAADAAVLHVRSIDLVEFVRTGRDGGSTMTPRTRETSLDAPFGTESAKPIVVGGYRLTGARPTTTRIFVVSRR